MKAPLSTEPGEPLERRAIRKLKTQQEYIEAWMRDDDISRREQHHHIEYDC